MHKAGKWPKTADATLRQILADTGHTLSVDDLPECSRLALLAERVENPKDPSEWELLNLPVAVGNTLLFPPSVGAKCWFFERPMQWFALEDDLLTLTLVWLLSRQKLPQDLWTVSDANKCRAEVRTYANYMTATQQELNVAVGRVWPELRGLAGSDDYGPAIAFCVRHFGGTPEQWIWGDAEVMGRMIEQKCDEIGQAVNAYDHIGKRRTVINVEAKMQNQKRLLRYANALRRRWSNGQH